MIHPLLDNCDILAKIKKKGAKSFITMLMTTYLAFTVDLSILSLLEKMD